MLIRSEKAGDYTFLVSGTAFGSSESPVRFKFKLSWKHELNFPFLSLIFCVLCSVILEKEETIFAHQNCWWRDITSEWLQQANVQEKNGACSANNKKCSEIKQNSAS